ncbi:MAG TPA: DNA primase [Candidatus Saccharimonadales bacterium]|nr:DNA primase [Candidatus Saccharimonadales bacterium]
MDAVEEIKQRLNIEDVISQYVELKRAGRNFKGLSPFSSERTPSFMVSPEKQIWHDFSSGKGGNMFSFVMEMEGLDFKGALELLARKAGVDLDQFRGRGGSGRGNSKEKERLHAALELAAKFYQVQFTKNAGAIEYVARRRKFTKQTVQEWLLGYSPNTGDALAQFLTRRGFSEKEIKDAGLSAQRYRGLGDMFRGRLMVPLQDPQGRVIGFTARLLEDDPEAPKYINTPQTALYDKSRHVYGLHLAKEAIRKTKYVVVAEGNLDVISSHQAGVRQVVATAGTALTEQHLKALGRFTGDIRLCFDADKAGLSATERAIPIASKVGVSLSIITIPSGKDPDELIKQDPAKWTEIIEQPQYAVDWLIERYTKLLDIASAQGKREFSDVILKTVRGLADPVEQEHYIGRVAGLIGVSTAALLSKFNQPQEAPRLKTRKTEVQAPDKALQDMIKTENHLLALALLQPRLRIFLEPVRPQMLAEEQARGLRQFLDAHPDFAGATAAGQVPQPPATPGAPPAVAPPAKLPAAWRPLADYGKMLALLFEELYQDLEISELQYEAARLQATLIERYVKMQKQRIAREQRNTTDEARSRELLEAANKLDNLLRHKGA